MLKLCNIVKDYTTGDSSVTALSGISVAFRKSEFVSVLGPSGCGKTTLLNIIGGLDQYTSGDLIINGKSTRDFSDADWDAYRNRSIGFVFQSYNLIPHQTVLANVELALTLSGVSGEERRRRAEDALTKVGLESQMKKKPNQLSGGQMQRVAIARALVNNPDILLADEPTGALDSGTSVQIMEILKEISRDRLIIMVTHNPQLAQQYSTRIIRLLDGKITDDSMPYDGSEETAAADAGRKKKNTLSFGTALSLSTNNLMTKKTRTFLTAFAGSIGIIGIALIMSLSNGMQTYINRVQEDTLSSYPLTIESESVDISGLISSFMGAGKQDKEVSHDLDRVYASPVTYDLLNSLNSSNTQKNNLKAFKAYLDAADETVTGHISAVQYSYGSGFDIYTQDSAGAVVKADVLSLMEKFMGETASSYYQMSSSAYSGFQQYQVWEEMLPGKDGELINPLLQTQYEVVYGDWPQTANEAVLIVDKNNEISDLVLYALGLKSTDDMTQMLEASKNGESLDTESLDSWSYADICGRSFKLILPAEHYQYDASSGRYVDLSATDTGLDYLYKNDAVGIPVKIVGVVRESNKAVSSMMQGSIGYTSALTDAIIERTGSQQVVIDQLADPSTDVITGLAFPADDAAEPTAEEKKAAVDEYIAKQDAARKAELYTAAMSLMPQEQLDATVEQNMSGMTREYIEQMMLESYAAEMGVDASTVQDYVSKMSDEDLMDYVRGVMEQKVQEQYAQAAAQQLSAMSIDRLSAALDNTQLTVEQYAYLYANELPASVSDSTYDDNLTLLGYIDKDSPTSINLYASTFEDKDAIADMIKTYNEGVSEADAITYTDYVALMMSSVATIIDAISYVLIAFVAISLVVSSIMIGIITYISVLERTKEIGILRAIGASKGDIARVFNAETLIEGSVSGAMGIGITLLLLIPANLILHNATGIPNLSAILPVNGATLLVAISMLLSFIAGLIPSGLAAKKDPVVALRTE